MKEEKKIKTVYYTMFDTIQFKCPHCKNIVLGTKKLKDSNKLKNWKKQKIKELTPKK